MHTPTARLALHHRAPSPMAGGLLFEGSPRWAANPAPAAATLPLWRLSLRALGTRCCVQLAAPSAERARQQAGAALAELRRIDDKYALGRPGSMTAAINAAAGGSALPCDDETEHLLDHADALYRDSDGLFDASSGVLQQAWNYQMADLPARSELAALLALIGWHRVERHARRVRLPVAGMAIDFGGFLQEYAADRAAAALRAEGVEHGYVDVGGDLRAIGPQPDGTPWPIAIADPRRPGQTVATMPLSEGGLAGCGDGRRFIEVGSRRYGDLLDARSGWPVSAWRAVHVQAPTALRAGAVATLAALRQGQGRRWLATTGLGYLAIAHDGRMHLKGPLPVRSLAQPVTEALAA